MAARWLRKTIKPEPRRKAADQAATVSEFEELRPGVALGVAAHPDDLDFGMAGTVAKWAAAGTDVYYLVLTDGCKGSHDRTVDSRQLRDTRRAEQRQAAMLLGVKDVYFYEYVDGLLEVTMDLKRDIARIIRQVKPDVVLTYDPSMLYTASRGFINHPDHRAAGQATIDAVYPLARDCLSFPELLHDEKLEPHETPSLLLLNFDRHNYSVDITDTFELKEQALRAHASQFPDIPETLHQLRQYDTQAGQECGAEYAELFVRIDIVS